MTEARVDTMDDWVARTTTDEVKRDLDVLIERLDIPREWLSNRDLPPEATEFFQALGAITMLAWYSVREH